jgi:hypothetical protein
MRKNLSEIEMKDPIVEEVRKARQDHAKEFDHNLSAICRDLKRIEQECGHPIVSFQPKRLIQASSQPSLVTEA